MLVLLKKAGGLGLVFVQVALQVLDFFLVERTHFLELGIVFFLQLGVALVVFFLLFDQPSFQTLSLDLVIILQLRQALFTLSLDISDLFVLLDLLSLHILLELFDPLLVTLLGVLEQI